ncbi:hypothetical protein BABINDRAFT_101778 [Babjeviella inositovora NRRL Y-12698]|uniref:Ras modification protein ERF4 n=1 Tax=Babjeviella inositovora NRRL Y-12698 TaxID=984486 RepID=A0A1E3QIC1_9ASCO|nr:uncharacterized protein BABINDRAFT_101778 [Babjeviella inositovora NRRL Y-12698]ODQ77184.1 hypothetical protein BABINDRAFT_101778 [Babjeviella inositovora NRRL Y-12698]
MLPKPLDIENEVRPSEDSVKPSSVTTAPSKYPSANAPTLTETVLDNVPESSGVGAPGFLFYNYHEYATSFYATKAERALMRSKALIVTHFPNGYVPLGSEKFVSTRVVRIPRVYPVTGETFPQFLTLLPGSEEAALLDPADLKLGAKGVVPFTVRGEYQGQLFGYSSVSPLSNHLLAKAFTEIVQEINQYFRKGYNGFAGQNVLHNVLDLITMGVSSLFTKGNLKMVLAEMEKYVETTNERLRPLGVEIMSPRRSGYLSLDFVVPVPRW